MPNPSPLEFLDVFHSRILTAGRLALRSATLRDGNRHTSWCFNLHEADRLCVRYRRTRWVRFGAALHDPGRIRVLAGRGVSPGQVRGRASSVSALPALWAVVPYRSDAPAGATPLPGRRQALDLFAATRHSPPILVSTDDTLVGFWPLDDLWVFDLDDEETRDQRAALDLLGRLQWEVAGRAAARGWPIPAAVDLAADFPIPGFVAGDRGGPPAFLEAFSPRAGVLRFRRRDFASLPAPAADAGPRIPIATRHLEKEAA